MKYNLLPLLAALALTLPWFIAIYFVSDGAFYAEALGRDFGAKIGGAQETHGGWPGYYTLTSLVMFWPGVIVLPLAVIWTWRNRTDARVTSLLCWLMPMWVVLELVPTKLPHYTLPLYPALALLCGAALVRFSSRCSRFIGALFFAATGFTLASAIAFLNPTHLGLFIIGPLAAALILAALWIWLTKKDAGLSIISGVILAGLFFGWTAPRSGLLSLTDDIMAEVEDGKTIVSPDYREPSLVYRAGTQTELDIDTSVIPSQILVLESTLPPACATSVQYISNIQYTKGRSFGGSIYATDDCAPAELETWRAREVARRAESK